MANRNSTVNPRRLGTVKPDLVCQQISRVRSTGGCTHFRESHDRRKLHLSPQCYLEASSASPSHLETKPVIPDNIGQQQHGKTSFPVCCTQAGKRADIISLRKHLGQARRLASAIKRGQSYLHLLQKEEQEKQEAEERRRMRREEQLRTEPQAPRFSSDSDSDSEGWPLPAGTSWSGAIEARRCRKKSWSARPFTPVYHSLTSPWLSEAPRWRWQSPLCSVHPSSRKVIYRQLCCLNWLLEALTLDRSGRIGPLTACWDPKDPGRGRTTIKTVKKERAIENKWEQFVSTKPQRTHSRRPRSSSAHLHTHRKSSFASVASLSGLTSTTVDSSVSSLVPGAEEDTETETDRPPSECLHPLSDFHWNVKKESQRLQISSLADSCPAKPPLAISHLINNKANVLQELKAAFDERVEEMAQNYVDVLELKARKRLSSCLQRHRAPCHMTTSHGLPHHVTCMSQETEAPNNSNKDKHSNNMWLSTLLSRLPEEVRMERAVSRVLDKLSVFAEQQMLRVRPQLFLKVLGGLEPWELCLPELCVAIQIAIEHVVQMPREEYDSWLHLKVTLPPQNHQTPQIPGEPHPSSPLGRPQA